MHPPVRLVAIDMDGTLLDANGMSISPRNLRALRAAEAAGITIAIATGRRTAYATPLIHNQGLSDSLPILSSNGAVTRTLGGKMISSCTMPATVAQEICALLRPFGCLVFTFDRADTGNPRELVLEDLEQSNERIAIWTESNRHAIEIVRPLEKAFDSGENPIQGMVAGPIHLMRQAEQALSQSPLSRVCASIRTEYPARDLSIVDLMPVGVSKARALEQLALTLGIDRSETMAIGDNWNDLSMLEWAAQGVLMANAAPDLRARAHLEGWKIAPANVDDGVAVILERLLARQGDKIHSAI